MGNLEQIDILFEARKQELHYYSPYSFIRNLSDDLLFTKTVKEPLLKKIQNNDIQVIKIEIEKQFFLFLVEYLAWDSNYFGFQTYRLHTILFDKTNQTRLIKAAISFKEYFLNETKKYCFTDIPSEDILLLQALSGAGFRLIETRMTYYLDLNKHNHERFSVREAKYEDIPNLRRVASEMRNPFDRFHADPIFDTTKADEFLATFIEESIKGFADYTIVPNEEGIPADAFLTAKYLKEDWSLIQVNVSKMVLSAVSSKTCKGWYKKLITEMAYHLLSQGAEYAFMHPASTNKAVIYTYETLGCRLGQVSHVFSIS
jgi:dTDP-4-amino-4,6-dideoxy-D-galactose acyltransferase